MENEEPPLEPELRAASPDPPGACKITAAADGVLTGLAAGVAEALPLTNGRSAPVLNSSNARASRTRASASFTSRLVRVARSISWLSFASSKVSHQRTRSTG